MLLLLALVLWLLILAIQLYPGPRISDPSLDEHPRRSGRPAEAPSIMCAPPALRAAAAHLRVVICVSLRTAASAEAPSSPMLLPQRLQSMGEVGAVKDQAE